MILGMKFGEKCCNRYLYTRCPAIQAWGKIPPIELNLIRKTGMLLVEVSYEIHRSAPVPYFAHLSELYTVSKISSIIP